MAILSSDFFINLFCKLSVIFDAVITVWSVVGKLPDRGLSSFDSSGGFSEKTIWYILTDLRGRLDNLLSRLLAVLHDLVDYLNTLRLVDVYSEIKSRAICKRTLSLNGLSSIFHREHGSWLRWHRINLLICTFIVSLRLLLIDLIAHVIFWLSTDEAILLWVGFLLVMGRARDISLALKSLVLIWLGGNRCSLFSQSLMICVVESLALCDANTGGVWFWHLHLLGWGSSLCVFALFTFFGGRTILLFGNRAHYIQFLIDFNWTMPIEPKSTILACNTRSFTMENLVEWTIVEVQIDFCSSLISCRGRKLGCNVNSIHWFFQSINFLKICTLWRLLGGSFTLISSSDGLRITLDDHWLCWWNFLLSSSIINICRWRRNNSCWINHAHLRISSLSVIWLRLLGWFSILNLLNQISIALNVVGSLLIWQVIAPNWRLSSLLFIRESCGNLIFHNDLLERLSIDWLSFVVTEHLSLSFVVGHLNYL